MQGGISSRLSILGENPSRHIASIALDASTEPDRSFVHFPGAPSLSALLGAVTDTQLHRYNFETLALLHDATKVWGAELSTPERPVLVHMIHLSEHEIHDADTRAFFNELPTSLGLEEESVDRLIALGRSLLRRPSDFQKLVAELGGTTSGDAPPGPADAE